MTQKEIKRLQARANVIEKAIKKNSLPFIWDMVVELIEIELELEKESNQ